MTLWSKIDPYSVRGIFPKQETLALTAMSGRTAGGAVEPKEKQRCERDSTPQISASKRSAVIPLHLLLNLIVWTFSNCTSEPTGHRQPLSIVFRHFTNQPTHDEIKVMFDMIHLSFSSSSGHILISFLVGQMSDSEAETLLDFLCGRLHPLPRSETSRPREAVERLHGEADVMGITTRWANTLQSSTFRKRLPMLRHPQRRATLLRCDYSQSPTAAAAARGTGVSNKPVTESLCRSHFERVSGISLSRTPKITQQRKTVQTTPFCVPAWL